MEPNCQQGRESCPIQELNESPRGNLFFPCCWRFLRCRGHTRAASRPRGSLASVSTLRALPRLWSLRRLRRLRMLRAHWPRNPELPSPCRWRWRWLGLASLPPLARSRHLESPAGRGSHCVRGCPLASASRTQGLHLFQLLRGPKGVLGNRRLQLVREKRKKEMDWKGGMILLGKVAGGPTAAQGVVAL